MSEVVVDRVARAICAADGGDWAEAGAPVPGVTTRDEYRRMARAAIEALRLSGDPAAVRIMSGE